MASGRAVERERGNRCLAFARQHGARLAGRRAALGLATPEAAGAWAARTALEAGAHDEALSFVDELVALSCRPSQWPRAADPARAVAEWMRTLAGAIGVRHAAPPIPAPCDDAGAAAARYRAGHEQKPGTATEGPQQSAEFP